MFVRINHSLYNLDKVVSIVVDSEDSKGNPSYYRVFMTTNGPGALWSANAVLQLIDAIEKEKGII